MKKFTALLLTLMLVFSLAACGSSPVDDIEDTDHVEDDVLDNDVDMDDDSFDVGEYSQDWNDYASIFTLTYMGITDTDETVAFVMTGDESLAALVIVDAETMEADGFVGEMLYDEESDTYTIIDEYSGLSLTFTAEFFEDSSIKLDMGDFGGVEVVTCEQSDAFDLLNEIQIQTLPVS